MNHELCVLAQVMWEFRREKCQLVLSHIREGFEKKVKLSGPQRVTLQLQEDARKWHHGKSSELRRGEEVRVGGRGASQTDYSSGLMLRMLTYAQSSSHTSCCSPHTPKVRQIPQEHASYTQEVLPRKPGKGLGSPDQGLEEGEVPGRSHRGTECPSHLGEGSWALTCPSGWVQILRHCRLRCVAEQFLQAVLQGDLQVRTALRKPRRCASVGNGVGEHPGTAPVVSAQQT